MKRLLLFLCSLVTGAVLWAQVPRSFSYQAVVRDAGGQVVAQQTVSVRLSLLQGDTETERYAELHTATTNAAGLVTLAVGGGQPQTDCTMECVDWGGGPVFLRTEVDPAGGSDYTLTTTQQLLLVPYALFAANGLMPGDMERIDGLVSELGQMWAAVDSMAAAMALIVTRADSLQAENAMLKAGMTAMEGRMQQYVDSAIAAAVNGCCKADTVVVEPAPDTVAVEWVDLGLPSGLLWATCNLGAASPEEYGDYYAWGETTTKSTYNWSTYSYANGEYDKLTKYCNGNYGYFDLADSSFFTDNLTTLQAMDDAATQALGNGARTPTGEEWKELMNNTTWSFESMNGVDGLVFIATNGNFIFLPAAGARISDNLNHAGDWGCYWSASLDESRAFSALKFTFCYDFCVDLDYCSNCNSRAFGSPVRAVRASAD